MKEMKLCIKAIKWNESMHKDNERNEIMHKSN